MTTNWTELARLGLTLRTASLDHDIIDLAGPVFRNALFDRMGLAIRQKRSRDVLEKMDCFGGPFDGHESVRRGFLS